MRIYMEAPRGGAGAGAVRRWLGVLEARVPHDAPLREALFADLPHFLALTRILEADAVPPAPDEPRVRRKRGSTAPQERKAKKEKTGEAKGPRRRRKRRDGDGDDGEEAEEEAEAEVWSAGDVAAVRGRAAELLVEWQERYGLEAPSLRVAAARAAPLAARPRSEVVEAHWRRVEREARERTADVEECLSSLQRCFGLLGLNDFVAQDAKRARAAAASRSRDEHAESEGEGEGEAAEAGAGAGAGAEDVVASAGLGSGAWQLEVSVSLGALRSPDTAPVFDEIAARAAQLPAFALLVAQWADVARTAQSVLRPAPPALPPLLAACERLLAAVQAARRRCNDLGVARSGRSGATNDVVWE